MDLVEGVLPVAVGGQRGEVLHQHGVVGPGCRPRGGGAPQPGGRAAWAAQTREMGREPSKTSRRRGTPVPPLAPRVEEPGRERERGWALEEAAHHTRHIWIGLIMRLEGGGD